MLFLSPVVQAGWEKEATIDDFEKTGDLGSGNDHIVQDFDGNALIFW